LNHQNNYVGRSNWLLECWNFFSTTLKRST